MQISVDSTVIAHKLKDKLKDLPGGKDAIKTIDWSHYDKQRPPVYGEIAGDKVILTGNKKLPFIGSFFQKLGFEKARAARMHEVERAYPSPFAAGV